MPSAPPNTEPRSAEEIWRAAIDRLRQGRNPFAFSVATIGTEENCLLYDVRNLVDAQRSDLLAIVDLYRDPRQPSRAFPIVGDPGTGKTHLLTTFQADLDDIANQTGKECLLQVADQFTVKADPIEFFLWQVVNHLLAGSGPGHRLLSVLSERVAARLTVESLRRLSPPQQIQLIPPTGWWERIALSFGSVKAAQKRLEAIRKLILRLEVAVPSEVCQSCIEAGLTPDQVLGLVEAHLEVSEPKDAAGFLRKNLYLRLCRLALKQENEPIEDFFTEEYRQGPVVTQAGPITRRLLKVLLELFQTFCIPVVLVFDQLEDFLGSAGDERYNEIRLDFGRAVAALTNNIPGLCLLIFAEQNLWSDVIGRSDEYLRGRLDQDFSVPGRPAQREMRMPDRMSREFLVELIQRRIRAALMNFDFTGLSVIFPFKEDHLQKLDKERTIRDCLRKLSGWFDEIVFAKVAPPPTVSPDGELQRRLQERLQERYDADFPVGEPQKPQVF